MAIILPVLLMGSTVSSMALDFHAVGLIVATATDNRGVESDNLEQRYSFGLSQQFTPYLSGRFGYQYFDLSTNLQTGADFQRRTRQPSLELNYNRSRLAARIAVLNRVADGTADVDNFEIDSLFADISWRPRRGPGFAISFRDDTNVADPSVFGRDTDSQFLRLQAFYNRKYWGGSYEYNQVAVENFSNGFSTDQKRHQVRGQASRSFFGDRFSIGFSGRASRLERQSKVTEDSDLAEPIDIRQGLFAIDTSPELGELDPTPTLVDGDLDNPAAPPIDIGGANLFRNIGADLGITRPISRLEISVDTASDPAVIWRVYRSRDNLVWDEIGDVSSDFDQALLRYRLQFPETEDRFFKVVNVSPNAAPLVLVTEIRAFLEVGGAELQDEIQSDLYRLNLDLGFRPSRRVSGSVNFGLTNDEDVAAGLVRRDFSAFTAGARMNVDIAKDLVLRMGYRYTDSEDLREPVLLRTQNIYDAGLLWTPLPTVDASLTAQHRDESSEGELIQGLDSIRLRLLTELRPDVRFITDVDFSRLDDPFAGTDRNNYSLRETVELIPTRHWRLGGRLGFSLFETPEGDELLQRTSVGLWTTWTATRYITLRGNWDYLTEDGRATLNQSYNLSYQPGPKLGVSATYRLFSTVSARSTSTEAVTVDYLLSRKFRLFVNLSRSGFKQVGGPTDSITSLRLGLRFTL